MPPSYSEPEAFIHHALLSQGARSESVAWLAPLVVSVEGRMGKWCGRYAKLGIAELHALGPSQAACEGGLLADGPTRKWGERVCWGLDVDTSRTVVGLAYWAT